MSDEEDSYAKLLEELKPLARSNATLAFMLKNKIRINLQSYLEMEYMDGIPPVMSAEQLESIPEPLIRTASEAPQLN